MPVMRTPRYSPPVHMIRLTEERQTVPYVWVHPDEELYGRARDGAGGAEVAEEPGLGVRLPLLQGAVRRQKW
jgi:hypothetical protein